MNMMNVMKIGMKMNREDDEGKEKKLGMWTSLGFIPVVFEKLQPNGFSISIDFTSDLMLTLIPRFTDDLDQPPVISGFEQIISKLIGFDNVLFRIEVLHEQDRVVAVFVHKFDCSQREWEKICSRFFRSNPSNIMGDTDSVTFTKIPLIPCEKLTGTANYNIWAGAVKMWFHGQGYEDHLTTKADTISAAKRDKWKQTDASLCTVLWFSIATNLQAQYQAFTTCYEVWEKAKKVFSNDVHNLYSVITKLRSLKLENMDVQGYLTKLDTLKANFTTLMPFTTDATIYAEQQSKYFMVMALAGLPSELDSVRNQILSGTNVPNYEAVSEQLLRLATPHVFGPVPTSSPTESSALASHYHGRGGRTGGRGGRQSIRCNYCNRYGHIEADCNEYHKEHSGIGSLDGKIIESTH
ncbi:unnamed protein product [Trifolium pratense]|uniref:Uncharacterized protein n=1 Tax=Trifolium pratense TaxID=57577 RepID=A0ACB0KNK0_TRIPR|nr:unnamed protein product [Trifolium pratense]